MQTTNMAQSIKDSFLDLEKHRQLLEDNIAKLRKSLQHWQLWEAEYEGFKEEILAASPPPNREQLVAIGHQYEGDLITRKEVDDILGATVSRSTAQVINILDRRVDYVEQNIRTFLKQIQTAEDKLAAATIISTPDVRNEEGLPLTEIFEELDEEGNVISSRTSTPGSAQPQLLEVLKKAGVSDLPIQANLPTDEPAEMKPKPVERDGEEKPTASARAKKGVSFAEDTKAGPELAKSQTAKRIEDIMKLAKQSEAPATPPIMPADESPEDSALRRQMLQYGMSEVGSVVAELSLEEGSDWSDEDYEDDETDSDDEEDEYGRSTGRLVNDKVRQRMIELEERLGARVMENIGKKASDFEMVEEGIGRIKISGVQSAEDTGAETTTASDRTESAKDEKKSVRFSEELDIAPSPVKKAASPEASRIAAPIGDIVERVAPASVVQAAPSKKPSRFKSDRKSANNINGPSAFNYPGGMSILPLYPTTLPEPKAFSTPIPFTSADERTRIVPAGPQGKTLASTVVERDISSDVSATEPDEMDAALLNQEVATEYHRLRNRAIQRQGGFMQEEESEVVPFTEEEGGPKKMSRFKAARLARG